MNWEIKSGFDMSEISHRIWAMRSWVSFHILTHTSTCGRDSIGRVRSQSSSAQLQFLRIGLGWGRMHIETGKRFAHLDVAFSFFNRFLSSFTFLFLSRCVLSCSSLRKGDWFWDYSRSRWMLVRFPEHVGKHTESHRLADRESKPVDLLESARLLCAPL